MNLYKLDTSIFFFLFPILVCSSVFSIEKQLTDQLNRNNTLFPGGLASNSCPTTGVCYAGDTGILPIESEVNVSIVVNYTNNSPCAPRLYLSCNFMKTSNSFDPLAFPVEISFFVNGKLKNSTILQSNDVSWGCPVTFEQVANITKTLVMDNNGLSVIHIKANYSYSITFSECINKSVGVIPSCYVHPVEECLSNFSETTTSSSLMTTSFITTSVVDLVTSETRNFISDKITYDILAVATVAFLFGCGLLFVAFAVVITIAIVMFCCPKLFAFARRNPATFAETNESLVSPSDIDTSNTNVSEGNNENEKRTYGINWETRDFFDSPSRRKSKITEQFENDLTFWTIEKAEVKIEEKLGQGSFGVVYKAIWRAQPVAVKQLNDPQVTEKDKENFMSEFMTMANIKRHECIVAVIGYYTNPLTIVTEYVKCGSLLQYLQKNKNTVEEKFRMKVILCITSAMLHLESEGVVHRDLAARNVLLKDTNGTSVVSDFGMSRKLSGDTGKTESIIGPIKWMAPECLTKQEYSNKSDAWAWAVTIWEIYNVEEPYSDLSMLQAAFEVQRGRTLSIAKIPETLKLIVSDCWKTIPEERPSFFRLHKSVSVFCLQ